MNPRAGYPTYALSRGASSANLSTSPNAEHRIHLCKEEKKFGGERGIRTPGSFESPVFKTGSINRSDISPYAVLEF